MSEFLPAFDFMIPHEGGYVDDPADAGGETKYGISKRDHPTLDIANLTMDEARTIYEHEYWNPYPYGQIDNQNVANKVFDATVNMGSSQSHKLLQRACGACGAPVVVDGQLGPITLAAVNSIDPTALLMEFRAKMKDFYYQLAESKPSNQRFLDGWLARANA